MGQLNMVYMACLAFVVLILKVQGFDYYDNELKPFLPQKRELERRKECFEDSDNLDQRDSNIGDIFEDESVKNCFVRWGESEGINNLLQGPPDSAKKDYNIFAGKFCSTWSRSKQCLADYFNRRCNSTEMGTIRGSFNFNSEVTIPSLMCEPIWENKFGDWLQSAKESGLFDCITGTEKTVFSRTQHKCTVGSDSTYQKTGIFPPFRAYLQEFKTCSVPLLHLCEDLDKSHRIQPLFQFIMSTVMENYDLFWSNF